jgi:hypothetical protein
MAREGGFFVWVVTTKSAVACAMDSRETLTRIALAFPMVRQLTAGESYHDIVLPDY